MGSTSRHEMELQRKVKEELKSATDPVDKIRLTALSRGPGGIKHIGLVFRNMDDDGSKSISFSEFRKGVSDIGCQLTKEELEQAFKVFDRDQSGEVDYDEFLLKLRGDCLNPKREKFVQRAFEKLDKDKSGNITVEDLHGVYDVTQHPKVVSGEWTEDEALGAFLANFDDPQNKDDTVTKEEFFSYYAGISASIDNDAYFALMMENAWKLNEKPRNNKPGDYKSKDLMDSFGKRTQRTNFGRSGSDLKCSMQVEERKNGSFNRNI
ncbi:calcyphosin-like protein isoform X2 [Symsagittifera roscoffensis]|uniref:calcyphosin-like protein isoform X2 n=1 Tax=Symsagittifera roscoffensis TaxID=84072 RepID=UPI00307CAB14